MKTEQIKKKTARKEYVMLFGTLVPKQEYRKYIQETRL